MNYTNKMHLLCCVEHEEPLETATSLEAADPAADEFIEMRFDEQQNDADSTAAANEIVDAADRDSHETHTPSHSHAEPDTCSTAHDAQRETLPDAGSNAEYAASAAESSTSVPDCPSAKEQGTQAHSSAKIGAAWGKHKLSGRSKHRKVKRKGGKQAALKQKLGVPMPKCYSEAVVDQQLQLRTTLANKPAHLLNRCA